MSPDVAWIAIAAVIVVGAAFTIARIRAERAHDREHEREFHRDYAPVEAEGGVKGTVEQLVKSGGKLHQLWQTIGLAAGIAGLILGRVASPEKKSFLTFCAVAILLLVAANRERKPDADRPPPTA